ncbi:unnamed protein product [Polarella glacialis]|uniref:Uncharacterized protein n=1 Tax=Polarella glacialis TaxID=89957 RepID=A0A813LXZ3_POLGL|nr:unnamed protein product [Polarella glacialis]CAE8741212.1 unnamed protein product [Polarella glacialis]
MQNPFSFFNQGSNRTPSSVPNTRPVDVAVLGASQQVNARVEICRQLNASSKKNSSGELLQIPQLELQPHGRPSERESECCVAQVLAPLLRTPPPLDMVCDPDGAWSEGAAGEDRRMGPACGSTR